MHLPFSIDARPALRLLALLTLLILAGCMLRRTYPVKGRVVGFGDDGRTLIVQHEEIEGLMPAMTMSFTVLEGTSLDGLVVQDAVAFRLVITRDNSWIDNLTVLPDSAVAAYPAGEPDPAFASPDSAPMLLQGDSIPPFTLLNQHGDTFALSDYRGRALLLTFIYTRCPLPEYCPRLSGHFQSLQPRLIEQYGDAVQQLSISFDPEYDTPEVLQTYARRYTDNTAQWTFATGSTEEIERITRAFGVVYEENGEILDHNLATALITPDGRLHRLWRGNQWHPDEVTMALGKLLD